MKAATFSTSGGPEVIHFLELPDPIAGPGEILIRTKVVGLNFADINRRKGIYPMPSPKPYILGYEGAGVVAAVGRGVQNFTVGMRVSFAHVPRANAELVKAPAWKVVPLPPDISFETAAGLLLQGLTAHYLTHDSFRVTAGQTVLIHSAAGGVGLQLLQIAKLRGAKTIGTVSHQNKFPLAAKAGADHLLLRTSDWKAAVLELTEGRGVDVVYDAIGTTLIESIAVTKPHGTIVYFGQAGGEPPVFSPNLLMEDSKRLVGGELWSHIADENSLRQRTQCLFDWVAAGKLSVIAKCEYPLARTGEAHAALESGTTQGKILLIT